MECLENCNNNELTQVTFTNNEYDLYFKIKRVLNNFNFFLNKSNRQRDNLKRFLLESNLEKFSKTFENI